MFNIKCEMWSGRVCEHKEHLIQHDGRIMSFETQEKAQAQADSLLEDMNGGRGLTAFAFTVVPA